MDNISSRSEETIFIVWIYLSANIPKDTFLRLIGEMGNLPN